ncbi:uncharacterized protein [Montipora capricornis]|uniref:uncharacterized protein isoform X2 n=1 Tax=Montipora capricornis TaxID=246305 RepID=UPI0035F13383
MGSCASIRLRGPQGMRQSWTRRQPPSMSTDNASQDPGLSDAAHGNAEDSVPSSSVGKKRKLCLAVPEDCYGMPPQLSVKLPKLNDLPNTSKPWRCADLPIDVLLLTVEDCEFLSCFSFLDQPFKSYDKEVGPIYFGYTGNAGDQKKLKVALMKCSKGAAVPGGSLTAVKNAVRTLRPKAVFSVGTCSGLSSDKIKLGDVVVSSKLTTPAGFKTPVSRHLGNLVRDAHCGWIAPLENRDELEVKVHCDGDILSQAVKCGWDDLHFQYPEAIAVETEGEGVFAAAYDEKVEWVLVKGVASFVNQTQLSRGCEWMSFASTMAASVVANMLNDPVVFQEWPHCNQEMMKTNDVRTQYKLNEIQETLKTHGVPTQDKLKEIQVPQFSGRRSTRLSTSTAPKNVGAKGASRKRGATCTSEAINDTTVVKRKAAKPSIPVPAAPLVLKVIARGIRKCAGCGKPISKVIPGYDAEQDRTMCFGRFETYTYWNKAEGSSKVAKSMRHYHMNPVCTDIEDRAVNINVGVSKPDDNLRALLKKRFNYNLP